MELSCQSQEVTILTEKLGEIIVLLQAIVHLLEAEVVSDAETVPIDEETASEASSSDYSSEEEELQHRKAKV